MWKLEAAQGCCQTRLAFVHQFRVKFGFSHGWLADAVYTSAPFHPAIVQWFPGSTRELKSKKHSRLWWWLLLLAAQYANYPVKRRTKIMTCTKKLHSIFQLLKWTNDCACPPGYHVRQKTCSTVAPETKKKGVPCSGRTRAGKRFHQKVRDNMSLYTHWRNSTDGNLRKELSNGVHPSLGLFLESRRQSGAREHQSSVW